jgi:hypothetical protein
MTHPRTWVVHFWTGQDGVLALALDNPTRREGGRELPDGSFFRPASAR